ncbi:ATP-binding protein, partial [Holdemanella porci]|uniref:ATP-binding protein n=1 Tax=Holdemanella porci TaxID=2652276 RepID=UPI002FD9586C
QGKEAFLLTGARQIGKTYLIRECLKESKYDYVELNFIERPELVELFENATNAQDLLMRLSLITDKQLNKGKTIIFFDEIQECPNIISSLKYFCQDFREIPVIATGSMVRIRLQRELTRNGSTQKFMFPVGKIEQLTIYPLSFDEFLLNSNEKLFNAAKKAYESRTPLNGSIHELVLNEFYKYLLIGGMPEAVNTYFESNSFLESRRVLKDLYDNYLSDMELYQASRESCLRSKNLFSNIYGQLNKESKNFSPGYIEEKTKTRDYFHPIQWLTLAHIVNQSFQLKQHVTMPLIPDGEGKFRLFLGDIGMFSYQSGINASSFVAPNKENTLSGIFYENYVANELVAKGIGLYIGVEKMMQN